MLFKKKPTRDVSFDLGNLSSLLKTKGDYYTFTAKSKDAEFVISVQRTNPNQGQKGEE